VSRTKAARPPVAVGYVRVSTEEQASSDAGLAAQRSAIRTEVTQRGWQFLALHEDAGLSGKSLANRPALAACLNALSSGQADILVVAKLDRLSRSLADAVALLARATKEGWRLVALDLAVDTTTPQGEMMAHILASFAQFERRLISQRTKDALAAKRAAGVRLGRPRQIADAVVADIVAMRESGLTLAAIATELNTRGVATAQGGARWYPGTVAAVLRSASRDAA